MRFFAYLAVAAAALLPPSAFAADISQKTADEIQSRIAAYFPELRKKGVIHLSPAGDHYEMKLDIDPIILSFERPLRISELTPIIENLVPRDDGLWAISRQAKDGWFIGDYFVGDEPSHFQIHAPDLSSDGVFDPEVGMIRNFNFLIRDFELSNQSHTSATQMSVKDYHGRIDIQNLRNGHGDINGDFTLNGLKETLTVFGVMTMRAAVTGRSLKARTEFHDVDLTGVSKILKFGLARLASGDRTLTSIQSKELASILRDHIPFAAGFAASGVIDDAAVTINNKSFTAGKVQYGLALQNLGQDESLSMGLELSEIASQPGVLPRGYEAALPKQIGYHVTMDGLKVVAAIRAQREGQNSGQSQAEIKKRVDDALSPTGRMTMHIDNTFARSDYYDVSVKGVMYMEPKQSREPVLDITVTARDLDKTVAFLQANTNSVPQFGQACFMLLMAKGFGKQEKDGTMTWHIQAGANRKVLINGREIRH